MSKKKIDLKKEYNIDLWDEERIKSFQTDILAWYDRHKRDLPWRQTKDPYKIWVSEIMLQQTQVATVIPYYERFIERLPDVKSLAEVSEEELLKLWEGLGYYSRVRNMQAAAQQIIEEWGGVFPDNRKDLEKLKGIGPYTGGAVASIAFGEQTPAVDGNVMRVFSRLFKIEDDISKAKTKTLFEKLLSQIVPADRPGDFNQAIMDLGATKSMPKVYDPVDNPLPDYDASYQSDTWQEYPVKKGKVKQKQETYYAFLIKNDSDEVLLEKRPSSGLLADFWTFPLVDVLTFSSEDEKVLLPTSKQAPELSEQDQHVVHEYLEEEYQLTARFDPEAIGVVNHVFSHRKWTIYPFLMDGADIGEVAADLNLEWAAYEDFSSYAFPVPQQKMIQLYQSFLDNRS